MEHSKRRAHDTVLWRTERERLRLECRECEVICERVVSPWRCLKSNCICIYAFEDGDTTYFGCVHKVFAPELDLAAFASGKRKGARHEPDPYGPIRVSGVPRPQCRVTVEQAYSSSAGGEACCNPTFFHQQFGTGGDTMKLTAPASGDPDDPRT